MKIGLTITIFNRLPYVQATFDSIRQSRIPEGVSLIVVDDGSTDLETREYVHNVKINDNIPIGKILLPQNQGGWVALLHGLNTLCDSAYDVIGNIDSDAIMKPEWMEKLLDLHSRFPDTIVSGFNTTENHPVEEEKEDYYIKPTLGGFNMLYNRYIYMSIVKPSLILDGHRWDWGVVGRMKEQGKKFIVTKPSVVQHIGDESSYRHGHVDKAHDF